MTKVQMPFLLYLEPGRWWLLLSLTTWYSGCLLLEQTTETLQDRSLGYSDVAVKESTWSLTV